jgi:hypothetical protein
VNEISFLILFLSSAEPVISEFSTILILYFYAALLMWDFFLQKPLVTIFPWCIFRELLQINILFSNEYTKTVWYPHAIKRLLPSASCSHPVISGNKTVRVLAFKPTPAELLFPVLQDTVLLPQCGCLDRTFKVILLRFFE